MLIEKYFDVMPAQIAKQIVVVTGVTRSGTSITGKLFATLEDVEYEYEPWLSSTIPVMAQAGLMKIDFAQKFMRKSVNEMLIERLLGRYVNMRERDDSFILKSLPKRELEYRWRKLIGRKDAIAYARKKQSIFMMKIPDFQPYYNFLLNCFEKCKFIHIIRNGLDVAFSISKKQWYAEERLRSPEYLNLSNTVIDTSSGAKHILPFHIPAREVKLFTASSAFGQALLSWCVLMEQNEKARLVLKPSQYLPLKYEDLLRHPNNSIRSVCHFLGTRFTDKTRQILRTIKSAKLQDVHDYPLDQVDKRLLRRVKKMMRELNYPIEAFK